MEVLERYTSPWEVDASDYPSSGTLEEQIRFLLQYAILAPSVHNTQPWVFGIIGNEVRLFADQSRCLKAADRDMRDLYVSLGCALENLVIAAQHFGFHAAVATFPHPENPLQAASVTLTPGNEISPSEVFGLFRAIPVRKTNHGPFDPEPVSEHDLHHVTACCPDEDVKVVLTADDRKRRRFGDLMREADVVRFSDIAYVRELEYWVRQGAYDTPWLVKKLHELACACRGQKSLPEAEILKGAPVLGLVITPENDRSSQLVAGRALERAFLRATSLGLSLEPITYILQVAETRAKIAEAVPELAGNPQAAFRLGYSAAEPHHSPRRPLDQSLVSSLGIFAVTSAL